MVHGLIEPKSCRLIDCSTRPLTRCRRCPPCLDASMPPQLNGAAGWLFLNHPDDIAHVCAANTRNYSERCEWLVARCG